MAVEVPSDGHGRRRELPGAVRSDLNRPGPACVSGEGPVDDEEDTMWIRLVTAVAVLVSGAVHLKLWFDGFRDIAVIGPSFMLNAVAALVIAALLVAWRHWLPLLLAVGFGAATFGAFVVSATVGLFGVHEVWTGGPVLTAATSEIVAVVAGLIGLARAWTRGRSGGQPQQRVAVRGADLH